MTDYIQQDVVSAKMFNLGMNTHNVSVFNRLQMFIVVYNWASVGIEMINWKMDISSYSARTITKC